LSGRSVPLRPRIWTSGYDEVIAVCPHRV